jgi:cytochrome b pre-mRNA-processing protein 3
LAWFFSRKPRIGDAHYALYGAIVAQSRQPIFYADWGVPDTLTGRFDMISLHMALVLRRLQQDGATSREFAQGLFDLFFKDMDRSLREMGVGDISVPKRIEKMGGLFYGLVDGLGHALEAPNPGALDAFVMRDLLPDGEVAKAPLISTYVRRLTDRLAAIPTEPLLAGQLDWDVAA